MKQDSLSPPVCRTAQAGRYTARMICESRASFRSNHERLSGLLLAGLWLARPVLLPVVLTVAIAASVLLVGGCQKSLFAPEDERSPYDRYDAIRAQRATPYLENEFGQKKPNLRGRLLDTD